MYTNTSTSFRVFYLASVFVDDDYY